MYSIRGKGYIIQILKQNIVCRDISFLICLGFSWNSSLDMLKMNPNQILDSLDTLHIQFVPSAIIGIFGIARNFLKPCSDFVHCGTNGIHTFIIVEGLTCICQRMENMVSIKLGIINCYRIRIALLFTIFIYSETAILVTDTIFVVFLST